MFLAKATKVNMEISFWQNCLLFSQITLCVRAPLHLVLIKLFSIFIKVISLDGFLYMFCQIEIQDCVIDGSNLFNFWVALRTRPLKSLIKTSRVFFYEDTKRFELQLK